MKYYPWPASAITPADMALLHRQREENSPRVPINELLARAIRMAYAGAQKPGRADEPVPVTVRQETRLAA